MLFKLPSEKDSALILLLLHVAGKPWRRTSEQVFVTFEGNNSAYFVTSGCHARLHKFVFVAPKTIGSLVYHPSQQRIVIFLFFLFFFATHQPLLQFFSPLHFIHTSVLNKSFQK